MQSIARHIIDVHRTGGSERASAAVPFSTGAKSSFLTAADISRFTVRADQLRRYIQFARTLNPTINEEGQKVWFRITRTPYMSGY